MPKSSKQKLCEAAIDLFSKEGFDSVTTKKIAEVAGVSEMTLFRHFGTKYNLFQEAYDTYLYQPNFDSLFKYGLSGELIADLLKIGHVYLDVLNMNKQLILMEMRSQCFEEADRHPLTKGSESFKKQMVAYLDDLIGHNAIVKIDTEMIAVAFMSNIIGHFFREVFTKETISPVTAMEGIDFSIQMFAKSLLDAPEAR